MEIPKPYTGNYRGNETLGRIVSKLIPRDFLILSRLGVWYRANPYHKYNPGDILILNSRKWFGYGIRPVAVVEDYETRESRSNKPYGAEGMYIVAISTDVFSDFEIWNKENKIPKCVERATERMMIFKLNIEHSFKKVKCKSIEEALQFYRSIEVDPKLMGFTAEQISAPLKHGETSWGRGYHLDFQE